MPYKLIKSNNNISLCSNKLLIIISIIISVLLIINLCYNRYEYFDLLKNKTNKDVVCSKNCCSTQWNTNIDVTEKSNISIEEVNNKYNKTNMTCNNGITDTGCVCVSKDTTDINIIPSKNVINALKLSEKKEDIKLMNTDELTKQDTEEITGFNFDKFNNYENI